MSRRDLPAWLRANEIADLLRLSVPIAISRLSWMLMSLTDAIVLGQNAPEELPYVLNAWLPIGIFLGFGMGILLGVQVLTAELSGRGEVDQSGRIFRRGLMVAIGLGAAMLMLLYPLAGPLFELLFVTLAPDAAATTDAATIASETASATRILALGLPAFMLTVVASLYLEALRRPILATVTMYIGAVVNLVLDLAFVAGWWGLPQLGADGVAIATTGTRWILVIVFAVMIVRYTPALRPSPPAPRGEFSRQMQVGLGTALSNVAEWGGFNATYVIATWIALSANVIYGYATQVMGAAFMIYLGIGTATSVRVAEAYGRGDMDGVRDASRLGVAATIVAGAAVGMLIWFFREPIALALVREDAIVGGVVIAGALVALMWLVAIGTLFDGLQATASMALRAQGVVWAPTLLHLASFFVLMLPLGYWLGLTLGRGAQGMLEAAVITLILAGFAQFFLLEWKTARHPKMRAV